MKNKIKIVPIIIGPLILTVLAILLLFPGKASAANCGASPTIYYVDFAGGNDSNNGISTLTPWQHCPGDNGGSWHQVSGSNCTLKAGDRVVFKGGVQYVGEIDMNWSGTGDADSQRIIYDGDSGTYATRWASGSDKAIVDGNNTSYYLFFFSDVRSYITINNFVLRKGREVYPPGGAGGGILINAQNGSSYVTVSYCDMSDAGIINNSDPQDGLYWWTSGQCLYNIGGNHWNIHHNTVTDCGVNGVRIVNGSYNLVHHNTFSGISNWLLSFNINLDGATMTDNEIYNNTFYDHAQLLSGYGGLHGNWIHIFDGGSGLNGGTGILNNMRIYNNTFYNSTPQTWTSYYSSGFIQFGYYNNVNNDGIYIYNNVFFNPENMGITLVARSDNGVGKITNVYILNNTMYTNASGVDAWHICNAPGDPADLSNITFKNNITVSERWVLAVPTEALFAGANATFDYNAYYGSGVYGTPFKRFTSGCNSSSEEVFNTWKNTDLHDQYGKWQDPQFVDSSVSSNFNLRLSSISSPAYHAGADLTSLCANPNLANLCYDKDGIQRPNGSAWNMGAYEYVSGAPSDTQAPTVPTNLSATAISSSQINLSWTASTDNVGVTGYRVYRNLTQINTTANTSYSDTGLSPSTTYNYTVSAYDAAGNVSNQCPQVFATTQAALPDTTPPSVPTNLSATAISSSQINLSWTASTDNVGVTGYRIYRCQGAGCTPSTQIATSATNSYSDTGLSPSTTYIYTVSAYDAAGNVSAQSTSASATTQATGTGPIAWWKLDEVSGLTAADSSGNGNNGTLVNGPAWTTGKIGGALSFDGVDDSVNAGSASSLDDIELQGGGGLTASAWIYRTADPPAGLPDLIVGKTGIGSWALGVYNVNRIGFFKDYTAQDLSTASVINSYVFNSWQHVAATWTGNPTSATEVKLYVNGQLVSNGYNDNGTGDKRSDVALNLYIGNDIYNGAQFDGLIDEVRIYNRVLSASEVQALYNAGAPDTTPPSPPQNVSVN